MTYSDNDLLFVPLGGSGEIGMNVNLYHYRGRWIMVDLGISFPDENTPGIDVVLPDLSFIADRRDALDGLVLTHGHEDHLGAIPYLWSQIGCPVYGTAFTLALLRRKLAETRVRPRVELAQLGLLLVIEREETLHVVENDPDILLGDAKVRQVKKAVASEDCVDLPGGEALLGGGFVTHDAPAAFSDERCETYRRKFRVSAVHLHPVTVPWGPVFWR